MRVAVVVVGDVGISPRMQYHALSLAKEGKLVDVVACGGLLLGDDAHQKEPRVGTQLPRTREYNFT